MLRKVKDGNVEIVECDLDPIVTGRILEGIVNMNAAIVSLLGLSVATNDQVNRDAASGVPTPNPAAPVQRMVRCNLRLGFKLLDECRFDCVVWENTPITGAWWHCRLSENASKQFGMSLKHQIEIGSCSLEDVREIQSYFDEGFLHSGFVLGASSHLDLSEHCQPEVQIWSEGIVKPEKLVMHPDMKDEEWARWDYVLSELSKTTNLAPFCSGISTEQQSESDVLPYEYDTLKTNDQVNRDAASDVPTSETADGDSGSTHGSFSATPSLVAIMRTLHGFTGKIVIAFDGGGVIEHHFDDGKLSATDEVTITNYMSAGGGDFMSRLLRPTTKCGISNSSSR